MTGFFEEQGVSASISGVLEKFDGDGTDEKNLAERIHIVDDEIVKVEFFTNGELVRTETAKEVD